MDGMRLFPLSQIPDLAREVEKWPFGAPASDTDHVCTILPKLRGTFSPLFYGSPGKFCLQYLVPEMIMLPRNPVPPSPPVNPLPTLPGLQDFFNC